nr:hypothetical protein [Rhodothermus marinus]
MGRPRDVWIFSQLRAVAAAYGFDFDTPLGALTEEQRRVLLEAPATGSSRSNTASRIAHCATATASAAFTNTCTTCASMPGRSPSGAGPNRSCAR